MLFLKFWGRENLSLSLSSFGGLSIPWLAAASLLSLPESRGLSSLCVYISGSKFSSSYKYSSHIACRVPSIQYDLIFITFAKNLVFPNGVTFKGSGDMNFGWGSTIQSSTEVVYSRMCLWGIIMFYKHQYEALIDNSPLN